MNQQARAQRAPYDGAEIPSGIDWCDKRAGRAITGGTMPTKEQWLAQAFVRFFHAAMNGNDSEAAAHLGAVLFECRGCDEELMAEAVSALVSADELPEVLEIVRMMVEGDHLKKSLFRRPNQSQD